MVKKYNQNLGRLIQFKKILNVRKFRKNYNEKKMNEKIFKKTQKFSEYLFKFRFFANLWTTSWHYYYAKLMSSLIWLILWNSNLIKFLEKSWKILKLFNSYKIIIRMFIFLCFSPLFYSKKVRHVDKYTERWELCASALN